MRQDDLLFNHVRRPPRQPQPGERLFEFLLGHDRILCELRDHGPYGIEAQFFRNEEFSGRRGSWLSSGPRPNARRLRPAAPRRRRCAREVPVTPGRAVAGEPNFAHRHNRFPECAHPNVGLAGLRRPLFRLNTGLRHDRARDR
jgi:hypothetical protein